MFLKLTNMVLLLVVYGLAYLSSATDLLWINMSELNSIFPFDVMPPGMSFMIAWSLIYVLLWVLTVMMWSRSFDSEKNKGFLIWLIVSHVLHILWLVTNGQELFVWNVIIIFLLWATLWKILDSLKTNTGNSIENLRKITLGAYYGWVSMATWVLGVSQLMYLRMPAFTLSNTWSTIAIAIGVIVTILSWFRWKNYFVLLLCLWGLWGVIFGILS